MTAVAFDDFEPVDRLVDFTPVWPITDEQKAAATRMCARFALNLPDFRQLRETLGLRPYSTPKRRASR